jgi:restriction endonuclease S subunit
MYVANCKGTKMPRGSKESLLDYKILDYSLPMQQHIVNTIGSVDDLIEKNQEIVAKLNKYAKLLIESLPKDGIGVLNGDDELQVNYKLKNDCKVLWIGIENKIRKLSVLG